MSSDFYEILLALILYIFAQFLTYVNSSKIYSALCFALILDFVLVQHYEMFLNTNMEGLPLCMPYLVLLTLYIFAVFEINGWKNLLDYIYQTITGHTYNPISIGSLFFLWPFFSAFLSRNKDKKINPNKLLLAITILVLSILKEIFKKNYIIIIIMIYQYNSPFIFWLWFNHLFLILILISLLAIDPKAVVFINEFFGLSCFAWLGSYQTLSIGESKVKFGPVSELYYNKKKPELISDLQNLEKNINLRHTILKRLICLLKNKQNK